MDLRPTILAKSDQLNAEDLAVPIKVTITAVREGSKDQPVWIEYEGCNGRPWKPCKGMRRVLVGLWGPDGRKYVGRQLGLFCDPEVEWGGIAVGGVRIAAMSHIEEQTLVEVKAGRGKPKSKYLIKPIRTQTSEAKTEEQPEQRKPPAQERKASPRQQGDTGNAKPDRAAEGVAKLIDTLKKVRSQAELDAITGDQKVIDQREWLAENRPELATKLDEAIDLARPDAGENGQQQADAPAKAGNPFDDDDDAGDGGNGQQQGLSWDAEEHLAEIRGKENVVDVNSYFGTIDFTQLTEAEGDALVAEKDRMIARLKGGKK
jgi:hypothetical protein